MNSTLAMQQTALLDMLHLNATDLIATDANYMRTNGHFSAKNSASGLRGLRVYRANAQALSLSALQASYPVLQQLLGEENFQNLASDIWQAMPPEHGDLAQWGGALAGYLEQVPQLHVLLQEHPYLPDVARVEWALHVAATATDASLDGQSFQLLTVNDPAELRLQLSPGCALLRTAYPVVAIVQLHDPKASKTHDAARAAISNCEPQIALIWRQGFRPMLRASDAASAALLEAMLQGQSLAAALDAAFMQNADFDFSAWLAQSVEVGVLLGVFVGAANVVLN